MERRCTEITKQCLISMVFYSYFMYDEGLVKFEHNYAKSNTEAKTGKCKYQHLC